MAANHSKEEVPLDTIDSGGGHDDSHDGLFSSTHDISHFTLEVKDLRELMELRRLEAVQVINDKYGGVRNICKRLFTSENEGQWLFLFNF